MVALAAATVAAAEGRRAEAGRQFEEAVAIFRRYGLPWDEAQAIARHRMGGNRKEPKRMSTHPMASQARVTPARQAAFLLVALLQTGHFASAQTS